MKTLNLIKLVVIVAAVNLLISCERLTTCQSISHAELTMLIDISDEHLFNEIQEDIKNNLPVFFQQSSLGDVGECQTFQMTIGNLSGQDVLNMESAKIGIEKKGLSGNQKKRLSNPQIVKNLIIKSLNDFSIKSKDQKYNSSTNILQTVVKSILSMEDNAENVLIIFSDLVENNVSSKVNFYQGIPSEDEIDLIIEKLVDPILLNELKNRMDEMYDVKIIIVQKAEPNGKVNKRDLKIFWEKSFKSLGIDNVKFIDNLTNKIK